MSVLPIPKLSLSFWPYCTGLSIEWYLIQLKAAQSFRYNCAPRAKTACTSHLIELRSANLSLSPKLRNIPRWWFNAANPVPYWTVPQCPNSWLPSTLLPTSLLSCAAQSIKMAAVKSPLSPNVTSHFSPYTDSPSSPAAPFSKRASK